MPTPLPVFIEPRGEGATIHLDVQAELIKSTKDVATVRFIDSRDEALITNDDGTVVVADGGILIRLAPVVEEGEKVRLDVDVHDNRRAVPHAAVRPQSGQPQRGSSPSLRCEVPAG